MKRQSILIYLVLLVVGALFVANTLALSFTQDDAYISYRYVTNYLNGQGLVFNSGEHVEGYTNFFYIIVMAFFGGLGIEYILISKIIGLTSGLAVIGLAFFWARRLGGDKFGELLGLFAGLLLAANATFAYWAISGLETLLFSALVFFGLYFAAERKLIFVPLMALATLTRPEGGLIFVLVLIYFLFAKSCNLREIIKFLVIYILLIAPQILFRLFYYHDLFPNPFYAKTGLSLDYIRAGLKYAGLFFAEYGIYGAILIIPLIAYKTLPAGLRLLLFVDIFYIIYIIFVGGDVLHEHRFFVPLLASLYLLFVTAIMTIITRIFNKRRLWPPIIAGAVFFLLAAASFFFPRAGIELTRQAEMALYTKMRNAAETLDSEVKGPYSLSCSTIGAVSYFSRATVIDMIGLTDSTIAKHPQPEVPGIQSTWKERRYNVPYLMNRQPDFILFSTGLKPSAPAERALFLSSKFRERYYAILKAHMHIYKLRPGGTTEDIYSNDPRFVNFYVDAINLYLRQNYDSAFTMASMSYKLAPPDFYLILSLMSEIRMAQERPDEALKNAQKAFEVSEGYAIQAVQIMSFIYERIGDSTRAAYYSRIMDLRNQLK